MKRATVRNPMLLQSKLSEKRATSCPLWAGRGILYISSVRRLQTEALVQGLLPRLVGFDTVALDAVGVRGVARKGRHHCPGPRIVDILQCCPDGPGQVWTCAGNSPQLDNEVGIRDRRNGGDDVWRRSLVQQATQHRTRLAASELCKRAGRCPGHGGMQIPEQIGQYSDHGRVRRRTAAGLGSDCRLGLAQQGHRAFGRQPDTESRGSSDRVLEARALHHSVAQNAHQGGPGFASTKGGESVHRSDLLRHRTMQPESLETAAQRLQRGHSLDQAAACNFRDEVAAIGRPDVRNGHDQRGIIQLAWDKTRP